MDLDWDMYRQSVVMNVYVYMVVLDLRIAHQNVVVVVGNMGIMRVVLWHDHMD